MLQTFLNLVPVTLAQSLLYAFVALAIMIPFRTLALPDLTSEGSFPLGGCIVAALLAADVNPWLATLVAIAAGFAAGAATALIHLRFRVMTLLAGILVATMIWSINLRVMGTPNRPVMADTTLFDRISPAILLDIRLQAALIGGLVLLIAVLLFGFYRSELGLAMRSVGANARLAPALGIDVRSTVVVGFGLANALAALGGGLVVQSQGYADVTMGFGILVNGLASLMIGEALVGRATVPRQLLAPVLGSVIYYQLVSLGLATGLNPSDLKLLTGLFVLAALAAPILAGRPAAAAGH